MAPVFSERSNTANGSDTMRINGLLLFFAMEMLGSSTLRAGTFVVTNTNDLDAGSLRQALLNASTNPGPDIVTFSNVVGAIQLSSSLPPLAGVSLIGPGARQLSIMMPLSSPSAPVTVEASTSNLISGLRFQGGTVWGNIATKVGGIIANSGILFLKDSELTGAYMSYAGFGGAIQNSGDLVISGCAIFGNNVGSYAGSSFPGSPMTCGSAGAGGALYVFGGRVSITNTTFASNGAFGYGVCPTRGGAIFIAGGSVSIVNCTFVRNSAAQDSTISGNATVMNSVFVGTDYPVLTVTSNNLYAPTEAAAGLTVLQDNGGLTFTCAPINGSPVIEAGRSVGAPAFDQIGSVRPQGPKMDIGAVEFVWAPNSFSLLVTTSGPGTVSREPDLVVFPSNAIVTLRALGAEDYGLANWTGDASGNDNPLFVTMNRNRTIGASFAWAPATVISPPGSTNFVMNTNPWGPASLRQAIRNVNASGGGVIKFSNVVGTISLGSELPPLSSATIIRGPGKGRLNLIPPSNTGTFVVQSGSISSISGLTILDSYPTNHPGGAFFNDGKLTLDDVGIFYCHSRSNGGAMFNTGSLTIRNSTLSANSCDSGSGGAIFSSGELLVSSSEISGNTAASAQHTYSFSEPPIFAGGGGIFIRSGSAHLSQCNVIGNKVYSGMHRKPYSGDQLSGDSGLGGGIFVAGGRLAAISCSISSNLAWGHGGSLTPDGKIGGSGGEAYGGGICIDAGLLLLTNSTLSHNLVKGGNGALGRGASFLGAGAGRSYGGALSLLSAATGVLANCTFSLNQSTGALGYGLSTNFSEPMRIEEVGSDSFGGGLYFAGNGFLLNCTVASNQAVGGVGMNRTGIGRGRGLFFDEYSTNSAVALQNTIMANDLAGLPITSLGHNLFANGAVGATSLDFQGIDPGLGPLQDNGGPTWTHALLAGSAAIDGGTSSGLAFDQRGQTRTIDMLAIPNAFGGDGADIGALEVDPVLRFANSAKSGTNILLRFTTVSDKSYGLEFKLRADGGTWTSIPGIVPGTGGIVTVSNGIAGSVPERYYRAFERTR